MCKAYPPHRNYTTKLPRKTITMKITIFHSGIFGNTQMITTNSPDLNPLDYHVWELCLNATRHVNLSQIPLTSWRKSCKQYGNDLPQNSINKRRTELYQKTLSMCESWGRHFEHVFKQTVFAGFWSVCKLWHSEVSNFHVLYDFITSTIMKIVIFMVIILRECLKCDHWLWSYCILSGGVFFEPSCSGQVREGNFSWKFWISVLLFHTQLT